MIIIAIIFIPVIMLTLWVMYKSTKAKDRMTTTCIPLIVLVLIYMFIGLNIQWDDKISHDVTTPIAYWIFDTIPVIAYIYITYMCQRKWNMTSTIVIASFMILNLSSGITLYLDDVIGAPAPTNDGFYINANGESIIKMKIWQICMALQFIWMACRFVFFVKKVQARHLHFSHSSKVLAISIDITILLSFSSLFIPNHYWFASKIPLYITVVLVSGGLSYTLYLLSKGYALTPVIDANNDPAFFAERANEEEVWEKIRQAIVDKKYFLQPGLQVGEIAQIVGTNRAYVSNAVNKHTGKTFNGYANSLRVAYATELMSLYPDKKLEEIAEMSGFASAPSFTKIYKKETGVSPKEGKKNELEKTGKK